jgi:hypothetical protein
MLAGQPVLELWGLEKPSPSVHGTKQHSGSVVLPVIPFRQPRRNFCDTYVIECCQKPCVDSQIQQTHWLACHSRLLCSEYEGPFLPCDLYQLKSCVPLLEEMGSVLVLVLVLV